MAGYWPSSFFGCLWTKMKLRSINTRKMNEANIQQAWSIKDLLYYYIIIWVKHDKFSLQAKACEKRESLPIRVNS